jgi:hypothetical protein
MEVSFDLEPASYKPEKVFLSLSKRPPITENYYKGELGIMG